ncbi:MAG: aminoacyl-tRNA hydrolase [Clostridia bacterium]|nr:aminoacyl-tRNA hydrolase [Clostridia bacterium]
MTHLVVGLGNPGKQYERTRHNAGFLAVDYLAEQAGVKIQKAKYDSLVAEAELGGKRVLLMKPQLMMNRSGIAVDQAASFYKIPPENVIVLSDDITLDVGRLRVRRKGSHGGHNGLKSIENCLGSACYQRIKLGVGQKPHPDFDLVNWVLAEFNAKDFAILQASLPCMREGLLQMLRGDTEAAMQTCNGYQPGETK